MSDPERRSGRLQLLTIAAAFLGPLLLAVWLYVGDGALQPQSRANNGALLEPVINLQEVLPESPLHAQHDGRWLLLFSVPGECDDKCIDGLHAIRQLRLMLGQEMDRVARIFLRGDSPVDTVFLADQHKGLITLQDMTLSELLDEKKPDDLTAGGYYLIDPQGNLVMYFKPGLAPREVVDDIKRLLKLSRIG